MTEMNPEGEPVFVDVDSSQQFPTLFAQLITAEEALALAKAGTSRKIERIVVDQNTSESTEGTTQNTTDTVEPETKSFRCTVCERYKTDSEERLVRHLRMHRGENPFQCVMCDYSTYNKAVFEEHVRVHQGIKPFKCAHCNYASASKKNAKKHERIHREDNPNKCKDCDFIGRNPQSFRHHRETHHTEKKTTFKCKHCNAHFDSKFKYRGHRKNCKKCVYCPYKYCSAKIYHTHMKQFHNVDLVNKKKNKVETKLFSCALCEWSSNSKQRILLHLIHHPNQEVDESVIDVSVLRNCGIIE